MEPVTYSIFDPTGNITALVESDTEADRQPALAAVLMERHPEVEQVGFVRFGDSAPQVHLRMAGGEFCGNATMSAAALYLLRKQTADGEAAGEDCGVYVDVSGAGKPVRVDVSGPDEADQPCFGACVQMPPALGIGVTELSGAQIPVVRLPGISHLIISPDHPCFGLMNERGQAERQAMMWCSELGAEGLGFMFLEKTGEDEYTLTPLVYVPKSNTVFWEHSCASGSAACAMALAREAGRPVDVTFNEPGGSLRVASDPKSGETKLYGTTILLKQRG